VSYVPPLPYEVVFDLGTAYAAPASDDVVFDLANTGAYKDLSFVLSSSASMQTTMSLQANMAMNFLSKSSFIGGLVNINPMELGTFTFLSNSAFEAGRVVSYRYMTMLFESRSRMKIDNSNPPGW